MAIAWFMCPYKKREFHGRKGRYCAMDDFTLEIQSEGGQWSETEVNNNLALVKVRASDKTLDTIANSIGFQRVNLDKLDASLSLAQATAIGAWLLDMGFNADQINISLGTLGDAFRLATSGRYAPVYDSKADTFVCNGRVLGCRSIESVDQEVTESGFSDTRHN